MLILNTICNHKYNVFVSLVFGLTNNNKKNNNNQQKCCAICYFVLGFITTF